MLIFKKHWLFFISRTSNSFSIHILHHKVRITNFWTFLTVPWYQNTFNILLFFSSVHASFIICYQCVNVISWVSIFFSFDTKNTIYVNNRRSQSFRHHNFGSSEMILPDHVKQRRLGKLMQKLDSNEGKKECENIMGFKKGPLVHLKKDNYNEIVAVLETLDWWVSGFGLVRLLSGYSMDSNGTLSNQNPLQIKMITGLVGPIANTVNWQLNDLDSISDLGKPFIHGLLRPTTHKSRKITAHIRTMCYI